MRFDNKFNAVVLTKPTSTNVIVCKGKRYQISFLKAYGKLVMGGNGVVYKATSLHRDKTDYVIKICRFGYDDEVNEYVQKRIDRFEREIEALNVANNEGLTNIVQIIDDGSIELNGKSFRYFIMEKCDDNLSTYLLNNEEVAPSQKLLLYHQIIQGIQQLNAFFIYHRDIKSDNILFKDGGIKVSDLGLVDNRNTDFIIEEHGEKIGPIGWLSPEAANKFLVEKTANFYEHSCVIGSKSEVFQLGKLGWYIFNGNLPIGQIQSVDFKLGDDNLFSILFDALQYDVKRRIDVDTLLNRVHDLFPNYYI